MIIRLMPVKGDIPGRDTTKVSPYRLMPEIERERADKLLKLDDKDVRT